MIFLNDFKMDFRRNFTIYVASICKFPLKLIILQHFEKHS